MEQELKIVVINVQKIVSNDTGEVYTKIGYITQLETQENFVGYSSLDAWLNGNALEKIKPYIMKETNALIGLKANGKNSLRAYIKKIGDLKI